ncbi:MAG: hypothetical protein GXP25_11980 [Planctomycetes bacterium]|nr:hypothetical protein [Planctomycetota bacterium]
MEGIRLDKADLLRKFKLSNRLAIRIGALLAKKTDLTAAMLEMATPGSDLEKLLCSREVLANADGLTTDLLNDLVQETGGAIDLPLTVVQGDDGWRTIALEEELLAEEGWRAADEEEQAKALTLPVLQSTVLSRREPAGEALSPEEVRDLKLKALTSSDEGERAASVRRLLHARIPDQEKAAVFFELLVDPASRGRTEALTGFQGMGFNADASAALRDVLQGKPADARFALDRLAGLTDILDEAHAVIVAGVLLEALRTTDIPDLQENILYTLRNTAGVLAGNDNYLHTFMRESLKAIQTHGHRISAPARLVLHGIAQANLDAVMPLLWEELSKVQGTRAKNFLLTVIAHLETDEEKRQEIAKVMAKQAVAPGETESGRLLLGHNLTNLGEAAVRPFLEILNTGPPDYRAFAVPFLDTLVMEKGISKSPKNEIASAFLQALKIQERRVRLAILETRICADEDIAEKLRRELAAEFIENLRRFPFPDINEQIRNAIEVTGAPAVDPLFDYVRKHVYDELTDVVVRILGRVVARCAEKRTLSEEKGRPMVDFCIGRLKDERVTFGGYACATGVMCASPLGSAEICERLVTDMFVRAWKVPYPEDILTALGHMAASDHVPVERKIIVAHIFLKVVTSKKPELIATERETEDGIIYEFGEASDYETVVVPAAIEGLMRICLCEGASDVLRRQITIQLMKVWREASGWVVIWSPMAVETLARSLGQIASSDKLPIETKLDIGKIIKDQIPERLSVVRAMGEICSQETESEALDELALDGASDILEHWIVPESESDEWAIAITSVAKIAARNALNRRLKRARELRARLIEILFDGLRDHRDGARESLEMLVKCSGLAKKQRKEIEDRLSATLGLVKV